MVSSIIRISAGIAAAALMSAVGLDMSHAATELKFTSSMMLTQPSVAEARIPMFERWKE